MKYWFQIFLLVVFLTQVLYADILFYKSQRYIKGKVTGQDSDAVEFRKEDGSVVRIGKSRIKKIIFLQEDAQNEQDKIAAAQEELKLKEIQEAREARMKEEARQKALLVAEQQKKAQEEIAKKREKKYSRVLYTGALWRNLLLPGWGQMYKSSSEKKKGQILMGTAVFSWLFTYNAYVRYNKAKKDYENYKTTSNILPRNSSSLLYSWSSYQNAKEDEKDMNLYAAQVNIGSNLLAIVYLYSLLDGYFYKVGKSKVGFKVVPEFDSLTYRRSNNFIFMFQQSY